MAGCAARMGVTRNTLSRALKRNTRSSPRLVLATESTGWSDAGHLLTGAGPARQNGRLNPQ